MRRFISVIVLCSLCFVSGFASAKEFYSPKWHLTEIMGELLFDEDMQALVNCHFLSEETDKEYGFYISQLDEPKPSEVWSHLVRIRSAEFQYYVKNKLVGVEAGELSSQVNWCVKRHETSLNQAKAVRAEWSERILAGLSK